MGYAKIFSMLIFVGMLIYGVIGYFVLPLTTFYGDLTHLGLLPETQFGWTMPQPLIDPKFLHQSTLQEADVLVIGDSFSEGGVWQTTLTQSGLKVHTELWSRMHAVCADIEPWLHAQGFVGKYLVIETVERDLVRNLNKSLACTRMQPSPYFELKSPRTPPIVSFNISNHRYSGKISIGLKIFKNRLEYSLLQRKSNFSNWLVHQDVKVVRLQNGCSLFSHLQCDDSLFLSYDSPADIGGDTIDGIEIINSRFKDVIPLWAVVPNKSTAYLFQNKQFWNNAQRRLLSPNLMRMTQQAIQNNIVDLYPANNTHFSSTGYLLMGNEIGQSIESAASQKRAYNDAVR